MDRIVDNAAGTLTVAAMEDPPAGSLLPALARLPGAGINAPHAMVEPARADTAQGIGEFRLLLLGDCPEYIERIVHVLHRDGLAFTWHCAVTVQEYLAHLDPPPDVILAGYHGPHLNAPGALALLRERDLDIPCIVVADGTAEEEALACIAQGAADYLLTDRLLRLGAAVRRAIRERRARQGWREAEAALHLSAAALQQSEARYRAIVDVISDFAYSFTRTATGELVCEWITGAVAQIFHVTAEEINARGGWPALVHPDDLLLAMEHERRLWAGQADMVELRAFTTEGTLLWLRLHGRPEHDTITGRVVRVLGSGQDITAYRQAGNQIEFQAHLLDMVGQAVIATDPQQIITYWNRAAGRLYGWTAAEALGRPRHEVMRAVTMDGQPVDLRDLLAAGQSWSGEQVHRHRDERTFPVLASIAPMFDQGGAVTGAVGVMADISALKQAEQALRVSETRYRSLLEHLPAVVYTTEAAPPYRTTYVSPQVETMLGFPPEAWTTDPALWISRLHPDDRARSLAFAAQLQVTGGPAREEFRSITSDGRVVWLRDEAVIVPAMEGQPAFCQGVLVDITARKEAEARVSRHVSRLTALRLVHMAISSSLDRRVTLSVILDQLAGQLGVDAAVVLVRHSHLQVLEHAASRGFRGQSVLKLRLHLGESHAGRAALERRRVIVPDLAVDPPQLPGLVAEEEFVTYIAQPLISKGEVQGVLVICQRRAFSPDEEWLDFLEALAEQAAIALDNAALFEGLQRANLDLVLAYDATIEGWSHALDLRDQETEGHSQRVTVLTVRLAQSLGIAGEDLLQVRRGALLHDIGKMGIPDSILLKQGPLTEEEWQVMRRHPTYAYELLQPIRYLQPALDIPYCHHEKWDGTGYPRGLRGEQIPLAARIFAVVDVYDALSSDRPYRRAWPIAQVISYLQEQSGRHFDPAIVRVFLDLLAES